MIVVATDAPLDARDLKRLAARAVFGLARTGSSYSNGSGDFAVAFSTHPSLRVKFDDTAPATRTLLPTDGVSPLFQAALEATEEAVYNSLLKATTRHERRWQGLTHCPRTACGRCEAVCRPRGSLDAPRASRVSSLLPV